MYKAFAKLTGPYLLSVSLPVFLLCGCAVTGDTYFPVKDVVPRHSTLGFSICPPPGAGWYERHQEDSLVYLKNIKPATYSISARATEIHLENAFTVQQEFHEYVKKNKEYRKLPAQYRNVRFSYSDVTGLSPFCVKYQNTYEDHATAKEAGTPYYKVKRSGIICMHPESPSDGIDMYYLERFAATQSAGQSFEQEGEQFLGSLQFHPVTR
jgi:hypothetical protein